MGMVAVPPKADLLVSRKLARWVGDADPDVRVAFHGALAFAALILPGAIAQFEAFASVLVIHYESLLVIRFDRVSERFVVVAYYVDARDPTPPDGPGGRRRPIVAEQVIERLGLRDAAMVVRKDRDPREGVVMTLRPAEGASIDLGQAGTAPFPLGGLGRRPLAETPPLAAERDLPNSRSTCFAASERIELLMVTAAAPVRPIAPCPGLTPDPAGLDRLRLCAPIEPFFRPSV